MAQRQAGRKAQTMVSWGPARWKQDFAANADALVGEGNGGAPILLCPHPRQPGTWPHGPDVTVAGGPQEGPTVCRGTDPKCLRWWAPAGASYRCGHLMHPLLSRCFKTEERGRHRSSSLRRLGAVCFHSNRRPPRPDLAQRCPQLPCNCHNSPTQQHQCSY